MSNRQDPVDLLCLAAHTDDAEIALGGSLRLLGQQGRSVWVCDLTRGELATNAEPDERWSEAGAASEVLGLSGRLQLSLPDGFLSAEDREQVAAVAAVIRALRPRWLACAPEPVRHPDHLALPSLVGKAAFLANLAGYRSTWPEPRVWEGGVVAPVVAERWQAEVVFTACPPDREPTLIFDCSTTWPAKQEALACYRSQFRREAGRSPTRLNDVAWAGEVERRGRQWGYRAGTEYGEALLTRAVPVHTDLPGERWA